MTKVTAGKSKTSTTTRPILAFTFTVMTGNGKATNIAGETQVRAAVTGAEAFGSASNQRTASALLGGQLQEAGRSLRQVRYHGLGPLMNPRLTHRVRVPPKGVRIEPVCRKKTARDAGTPRGRDCQQRQ